MDPVSLVKQGTEIADQAGLAVTLAVVICVILAWVVWFTFTKSDEREKRLLADARAREDRLLEIIKIQGANMKELAQMIGNLVSRIEGAQLEHQQRHQQIMTGMGHCREENEKILERLDKLREQISEK